MPLPVDTAVVQLLPSLSLELVSSRISFKSEPGVDSKTKEAKSTVSHSLTILRTYMDAVILYSWKIKFWQGYIYVWRSLSELPNL